MAALARGAGGTGRALPLPAAGTIVVGRSRGCDVVMPQPTVSRQHLELRALDGAWLAVDLGSSNGTWLMGRRVGRARVTPATSSCSATARSCSSRRTARAPRIGARIAAGGRDREALEEVRPAAREAGGLVGREVAVHDLHLRAAAGRAEAHLDRARARGQALGPAWPQLIEQAVGRLDLEVAAADRDAVDVDVEGAARPRLQEGVVAHPAHHRLRAA